jgi:ABC-type amino acid transport system permease subunit
MYPLKLFTLLYSVVAVAFVSFAFKTGDFLVLSIGIVAFVSALCSCYPWWHRTNRALGNVNVIFGWTVIVILAGLQVYGLSSGNFGFSPFLISFLVLMLIATADAMHVIRGSSRSVR